MVGHAFDLPKIHLLYSSYIIDNNIENLNYREFEWMMTYHDPISHLVVKHCYSMRILWAVNLGVATMYAW